MNVREFVKQFAPPIVLTLYETYSRLMSQVGRPSYIWEGIYPHYRDVPAVADYSDSNNTWAHNDYHTRKMIAISKQYGTIPTEVVGEHILLPILASILCQQNKGKLRILDVGGSTGIAYVHLLSSIVGCIDVDYHIVELERACQVGSRLFEHDDHIHFHSSFPDNLGEVDIVHLNGVLQYIENYEGFLERLCAYQGKYVFLIKLYTGDFSTYATAQINMPGSVLPHWCINVNEIIQKMRQGGYSLILKGALEHVYNQDNLPEEYRSPGGRYSVLLFARSQS